MTDVLTEPAAPPADMPLRREVPVALAEGGDGRTLIATFVPYNEIATVADPPDFTPYRERFLPGAFQAQLRAAHRIKAFVNYRHGQGIGDQIGAVKNVTDTPDALKGEIRIFNTPNGDTALEMYREGLDKISVEFFSRRHRKVDGVVDRLDARFLGLAMVPEGAYPSAAVTGMRSLDVTGELGDGLPPLDPLLASRLSRFVDVAGIDDVLMRSFTEQPWDGSSSRWATAEAYCAASAIDLNRPGAKTKDACHLPYREPGSGDVNVNAVRNALARLGAGQPVDATQAQRDEARVVLERLLQQFNGRQAAASARAAALPSGMAELPAGVTICSVGGTPGFKGAATCHLHDGTDAGMARALGRAKEDAAQ